MEERRNASSQYSHKHRPGTFAVESIWSKEINSLMVGLRICAQVVLCELAQANVLLRDMKGFTIESSEQLNY